MLPAGRYYWSQPQGPVWLGCGAAIDASVTILCIVENCSLSERARRMTLRTGRAVFSLAMIGAATLLAVGVALLLVSEAPAATSRYPDLKTLQPYDLRFETRVVDETGTPHNLLRFSNTVWNAGEGPLEIHAKTVKSKSSKKTRVNQYVYDDAGGFTSKQVGDMVFHASHNHFHFENFASYELWKRADYDNWVASNRAQGQAIKRGTKTTTCVMDTDLVQPLPNSPNSPVYNFCDLDVQGMSVGWGDTYGWWIPDQWIDLGTSPLPDGEYVLRSVADPSNKLYESANRSDTSRESQQDNEGVTFFTVEGSTITLTS
jgi:hypothetical protein